MILKPITIAGWLTRLKAILTVPLKHYDTAMQLKPDSADAYYNRGEAWLHSERMG